MRGFLPSSAYFVGYYEWCFLLRPRRFGFLVYLLV
jgi:hypothetical protein